MKLGEIFIQLKLDLSEFKDSLLKQKSEAEKIAKEIEKINVSTARSSSNKQLEEYNRFITEKDKATKRAINEAIKTNDKAAAAVMQGTLNYEKYIRQEMSNTLKTRIALNQQQLKEINAIDKNQYNQLIRGIEQARKEYNASLGPQKTYLQNTVDISKQVLAAAPGFAIATAAIAALYAALRMMRDEFIRGLKAVEDYQVSVAEMAAFLTTFSENIRSADVAKIYGESRKEAEKLVQQMELLDARTVATGRDLTIMAEQFIKGGVKIDTASKSTIDGFANIANALKLLTQGQNQEIQMRQEIRSLVQGQLRDSNILVKTLQSVDPEIKNHIVLWKQQGTIIENVGRLLVGFGPAAKDLEDNWVIIGSTMETIHNRILRGAFLPTYESLIKSAKAWNSSLMNADGTLTNFAKTIQKTLMFMAKFTENFIKFSVILATGGIVYGAIYGIIAGVNLLTLSFNTLTAAMLANPLTAGLVAITIAAAAKTINDLRESNKELADKMGDASGKARDLSSSLGEIKPPNKDDEAWSFMDWFIEKLDKAVSLTEKLKQAQTNMNVDKNRLNAQGDAEIERQKNEYLSQGKSFYDPTVGKYIKPTGNALDGQFEWMGMDEGEIKETSKNVREYISSLKEKYDELSGSLDKSAVADANAKLKTEEFVKALEQLKNGGKLGRDEVEKLTKEVEFYSSGIDRLNKGKEINQAREDLQKLADSLLVKNAALDKSKASEMAAMLQTEEWIKKIKLAGEEGKKEVAIIMARSIALDKDTSSKKADDRLKSLQERLESQAAAFDKGESAIQTYNSNLDLLAEYLKNASPEGKKLEETLKGLNDQILKGNLDNLTEKLDEFIAKYKESGDFTPLQEKTYALNNEYQKMLDILNSIIEANDKMANQGQNPVYPTDKVIAYKEALLDAKNNGLKQLEYEHDIFRKNIEKVWQGLADYCDEFFFSVLKGNFDDLGANFEDMVLRMVADWESAMLKMALFGNQPSLSNGMGNGLISQIANFFSGFLPLAKGGIFSGPGISAYSNSIVSEPTIFPFAKGTALMGENGSEGILPLGRTSSGELGVKTTGDGESGSEQSEGVTVNIINYSSEQATKREYRTANGGRSIDVQIGEAAAANYMQRGALYKAINSKQLAGR